jgi:aldehyde dehydrogenase (NAD+)
MGASHGWAGFQTFSHMRPVVDKSFWPDTLKLIMPPYGRTVERVIKYLIAKE